MEVKGGLGIVRREGGGGEIPIRRGDESDGRVYAWG